MTPFKKKLIKIKKISFLKVIASLNYYWKMTCFLMIILFFTMLLILISVTFSTGQTIKNKSAELIMQRLELATRTVETILHDFDNIATYIIADSRVQMYLRTTESQTSNYTQLTNEAYHLLTYLMNSNSYLDYVSIYKNADDTILYQGETWTIPNIKDKMRESYNIKEGSYYGYGTMMIKTEPSFFRPEQYCINIFQPIMNQYQLQEELGTFLISINHKKFSDTYSSGQEKNIDIYITDAEGRIVSSANETLLGTMSPVSGQINGEKGSFEAGGNMHIYSRLEEWDWYVVGYISMDDLLQDNRETMSLLILLILSICVACAFAAFKLSKSLYKPLGELVENMAKVSHGELSTRMDAKVRGADIDTIVTGFNNMLDEIVSLMESIEEKQHKIAQGKLNALQDQIKPHFLYNTLDCIHWQAVVDGNKDISVMVKALANYYRICLSKGQDVISLSQEIAHIKSYMIIQNMRYNGVIEMEYAFGEILNHIMIPKMTLQPLVENAIYHGIRIKSSNRGRIAIRVFEKDEKFTVSVEDTGIGMKQDRIDEINQYISSYDESFGYGVRNVHKRIELTFGIGYGLYFRHNSNGGVSVDVNLPKIWRGDADKNVQSFDS